MGKMNKYELAKMIFEEYKEAKEKKAECMEVIKLHEQKLLEFAKENDSLFINGVLEIPGGGRLRWAEKSVIKKVKKFSSLAFFEKFRHFCSINISVAGIKKAMQDPELAIEIKKEGISLEVEKEFKIETS